jgi:hypothetical protein
VIARLGRYNGAAASAAQTQEVGHQPTRQARNADLKDFLALVGAAAALVVSAAQAGSAPAATSTPLSAHISVVASKSFCLASGISDFYTGDGKVIFYMTLRNTGSSGGKVNIILVRHYDDGEYNASAMDMLIDVSVPAHSVREVPQPRLQVPRART